MNKTTEEMVWEVVLAMVGSALAADISPTHIVKTAKKVVEEYDRLVAE